MPFIDTLQSMLIIYNYFEWAIVSDDQHLIRRMPTSLQINCNSILKARQGLLNKATLNNTGNSNRGKLIRGKSW